MVLIPLFYFGVTCCCIFVLLRVLDKELNHYYKGLCISLKYILH